MATQKQIDANRKNAQRSTGPKWPPGKHRSSLNAVKLGIFAQTVLLPNEDPKVFAKVARDIYADWNPKTSTQRALVDMLIATLWRSRRFQTVEVGLYQMYRYYKEADRGLATAFVRDGLQVDSFSRLTKCETALERRLFKLLKELERLQASD